MSGDDAKLVRRRVRRSKLRTTAVVLFTFVAAGSLVATLAAAGLILLPLEGIQVSRDTLWIADITGVSELWDLGYDGSGVTICLVDTGIDLIHPDLAGIRLIAWKDFVNGEALPYDDGGHGTAMAGLTVANGRLRGLAPGASLIVAKALRANGTGNSETIGRAIRFCMDPDGDGDRSDGADIISLSLGAQRTPFKTNSAAIAAREALSRGIFVVSSAGNDGREDDGDVGTPANEPLVIAVGALNHRLEIAAFSSSGNNSAPGEPRMDPNMKPEFVLPGVRLSTTALGSSYSLISGTSASAAVMSGILAVLLQAHPELRKAGVDTIGELKMVLMATAMPLPGQQVPHDDYYGYGLPQAYEAHLAIGCCSPQP